MSITQPGDSTDADTRPRGDGWEGLFVVARPTDDGGVTLKIELGATVGDLTSRQNEACQNLPRARVFTALESVIDTDAVVEAVGTFDPGFESGTVHVAVVAVDPDTGRVLDPVRLNGEFLAKDAETDALPFAVNVEGDGGADR